MRDQHADIWQEMETWCRTATQAARLAQVSVVLASLRGYLTLIDEKKWRTLVGEKTALTARSILDALDAQRAVLATYPAEFLTMIQAHWDRLEQDLYELLLPPDVRQQAADAVDCHGQPWGTLLRTCIEARGSASESLAQARAVVTPDGLRAYRAQYLARLRTSCATPSVQARMDRILGAGVTRGRGKTVGASIKNWPLVGDMIMMVYVLLWPLYWASADNPESTQAVNHEGTPAYPQVLREAVARLFITEFPTYVADLTAQDVMSRVQYRMSDPRWAH